MQRKGETMPNNAKERSGVDTISTAMEKHRSGMRWNGAAKN